MLEIFCVIDDFCNALPETFLKQPQLSRGDVRTRRRSGKLSLSEVMTILVLFQSSSYRNFKAFYLNHVSVHWHSEFPNLVSYSRFVRLMPRAFFGAGRAHG